MCLVGWWFWLGLNISKIEKYRNVLHLEKVGRSMGELIINALRLRKEEIIELTPEKGDCRYQGSELQMCSLPQFQN